VWLRKKTQNLPTSCTSCRLNPHNQLGRPCVYGIYKRTLRAPTKENALVLTAVDIGGKNLHSRARLESELSPQQVQRSAQCWGGILGRWGGLWLPARERTLTAVTRENVLFLHFDLFCRFFWIFFFLFTPTVVVVDFIGTMKSNSAFEFLFSFLSHIFYCCYKSLPLYWVFVVLWDFPFFFLSSSFFLIFLILIFLTYYFFYIYSFVCFPSCSFPLAVNL